MTIKNIFKKEKGRERREEMNEGGRRGVNKKE